MLESGYIRALVIVLLVCVLLALTSPGDAASPAPPAVPGEEAAAEELLAAAVEAMGGRETLEAVRWVRMEGMEHQNLLEQSERPEGPWIVMYRRFSVLLDLEERRARTTSEAFGRLVGGGGRSIDTIVADGVVARQAGDRQAPGFAFQAQETVESIALGPERVLLTASAAEDLSRAADTELQDVAHHVLTFTWRGRPVRVLLNAHTLLPTAVEWTRHTAQGMWSVWGDHTVRVVFSLWELHPGGVWAPSQRTELRNGVPWADRTLWSWEPVERPEPGTFSITEETAAAFAAAAADTDVELGTTWQGAPGDTPELAPGVVQIQGRWHVTLVRQEDGVVILEAPISSSYSAQVIDEARRRFPDLAVKSAVSTSDAWPHVAGVREYVARGVPLRVLDLNAPLLRRLVEAPYRGRPDRLARDPRAPDFRIVEARAALGDGANRIELIPVRGEGGERMMLAWLPEHRLLYASDLIQPGRDGDFFMPAYLAEVEAAVQRHGLEPETVFAMHLGPTPWSEVEAALAELRQAELVR